MQRIETRGAPRERGVQQGRAVRELALPWVERVYGRLGQRFGSGSREALIDRLSVEVARWRGQTEAVYPDGVAEYAGLAEGLGVDLDRYLTLVFSYMVCDANPQCTVVAARDGAGTATFAKTDDIEMCDLGMNILEVTRPDSGHAHLHFHFAGTPWSVAGMNATGFAMGMTGIPGPQLAEDGVFSLLALHTVLPACATVDEAIDHVQSLPVNAYGFSLMVGDASGQVALLEKSGAGMSVTRLEGGTPLAHTNHILDPDLASRSPAQVEPIHTNGVRRLANARHLLSRSCSPEAILSDRASEGAVCQHGEDGLHTDFGVLFRPAEGTARLWAGYPDEVEPEELNAGALLR